MRAAARLGRPGRGRLPGARGLRAPPPPPPPPPVLALLALLALLPAPGAAAALAPRSAALPPAATGPSVSLYLSEDEVRRLIGECGRRGLGGQVGPEGAASGRPRLSLPAADRGRVPSPSPAPKFALRPGLCLPCWPGGKSKWVGLRCIQGTPSSQNAVSHRSCFGT
ncbi:Tyrosine-protein kinase RYK [Plecturocebus cupreus]